MPDITFDLIIATAGAGYTVRAEAPAAIGELAAQPFVLPFDLGKLPQKRREAAEWVAQARIARRRGAEEQRMAREFGAALFERRSRNSIGTNSTGPPTTSRLLASPGTRRRHSVAG
jgi:hypothetical protein